MLKEPYTERFYSYHSKFINNVLALRPLRKARPLQYLKIPCPGPKPAPYEAEQENDELYAHPFPVEASEEAGALCGVPCVLFLLMALLRGGGRLVFGLLSLARE